MESSSSGSDEDVVVEAILSLGYYLRSRYAPVPQHDSILQGSVYYRELMTTSNDARFYNTVRMQRPTFQILLTKLEATGQLQHSPSLCTGEKLAIFISVLTGMTNRAICERWQHSGSTISRVVDEVLTATTALQEHVIRPPASGTPAYILNSPKFFPYFEDCIGALDGTHIAAVVPESRSVPFRNRKGFLSQNVLAVCDFDMMFCYVLAGWEGSAHDGRVLEDALTRGFPEVNGKYYMGDAGYALTANTLTPYRGVRYHLQEWGPGLLRPQTKEELFNMRHASLRNIIERIFGVVKKKFPLLQNMRPYPFRKQIKLVMSAFVFHNIIQLARESPGAFDLPDRTPSGSEVVDPDILDEDHESAAMKTKRDEIASKMWCDYLVYIADRDQACVV